MELHDYTINIKDSLKCSIIPLGDIHLGHRACSKEKFKELVGWIGKTSNVYVVGMGDYIDSVNYTDPRFNPRSLPDGVDIREYLNDMARHQSNEFIDIMRPIKHKIIGLGIGNHEMTIQKRYHQDVMINMCGALQVKYLGWSSFTRLRIKAKGNRRWSRMLILFSEHSRAAGKKKGGKINALEDRSNDFEADIYLRGHSHDKLATTKVQLHMPKTGQLCLRVKKRVYAICPSYFNSYREGMITYGEVSGYPPTTTGVVRIDIDITNDGGVNYHLWQ